MKKEIKITYNGLSERSVSLGTTFKEISEHYKNDFKYDILCAKVGTDIVELGDTVTKKCNIEFFDRSSSLGHTIYESSAIFILILAIKNIYGDDAKVVVRHSLDNGIYCELVGITVTNDVLDNIYSEMNSIVEANYLFEKYSVSRSDAIKYFKNRNQIDKVNVLRYISNTYINLYRLDDLYDYFYSKLAYSTKQIDDFKLNYVSNNGFVLSVPTVSHPNMTREYRHHENIALAYDNMEFVARNIGVVLASDLNRVVSNAKISELINHSEAYYNSQLQRTAADIVSREDAKLVLLAGPSSSGKTTTSKKLVSYLKSYGKNVVQISVDNYYKTRELTPKDENGNYDYECLEALDLDLLNEQLIDLMNGKEVQMPIHDFVTGENSFTGPKVKLEENDILIVEGIHCINDNMTPSIDKKYKYKIYICPLIELNIDKHNYIHSTDIRKLRRIIRDSRTRGCSALDTLKMWDSIRIGEEKYIYPYSDSADIVINSSLLYEVGVLKTYAEPLLFAVNEDEEVYSEALRLINFLRNFLPIPSDHVPIDSVLREFIGGSCFRD